MKTRNFGWLVGIVLMGSAKAQVTQRVSIDSSGGQANGSSGSGFMSADGRFVVFEDSASNLVPGDTNGYQDIFIHDRLTGLTERVSVSSTGEEANAESDSPSVSGDGRFVAFHSGATNLVPGDTNGVVDVFVRDRQTQTTTRASVDSSGIGGNGDSYDPSLSADGRYVAFWSYASNLVSGDTGAYYDVFVHDQQTGATIRVSVDSSGAQANQSSYFPSISATGRYVAFESTASNLVADDTNGRDDIFVRDIQAGTTQRVSLDSSGVEANDGSYCPAISGDGRYVAFESSATNLVTGDTNGRDDIFVHDCQAGPTVRISVSSSGGQANNYSGDLGIRRSSAISADGRYVSFQSMASNLVTGDNNGKQDVFVRDSQLGTTTRVTIASSGVQAKSA
jgi:Tol biopolymer transport system component